VLHSLFEEQIDLESMDLDRWLSRGADTYAESLTYFPDMAGYNRGAEGYLDHVRKAVEAVDIPVIGSLNGVSTGGWAKYAREIEQAGADALELNVYFLPTDPMLRGAEVEKMYLDLIGQVKESVRIPVAVKLGPYFSSLAAFGRDLNETGVDGIVLFNRFYQPDFDLDRLEVVPSLTLSDSSELLLRLHWVAILYGYVSADLAVTGGVHTARDALKAVMAGASVAMMTSALLKRGVDHLAVVRSEMFQWMEEHGYESIRQMRGSMSLRSVAEPAAFERANYMKVLRSYALRKGE
jgi:dihydroorotate dehydrogenase (fumarate)